MEFGCLYMSENTSTIEKKKKNKNKFVRVRQRHIYFALFKQIQAYYTIFVTVLPVCGWIVIIWEENSIDQIGLQVELAFDRLKNWLTPWLLSH